MMSSFAAVLTVAALTAAQPAPGLALAQQPTSGRVVLECIVAEQGALTDCLVVEETPPGHGLAQRALEASAKLKMDVPTVGGVAVNGARVRVPFDFQL
jgi:TonB family protein